MKITPDPQVISLRSLIADLEQILDEPLLILSFLSRKSITLYEARATFISADYANEVHRDAHARYQQNFGYESGTDSLQFNVPVDLQALKEGLFQTILHNYESSPLKSRIQQTIQYLLVSYERGYFEARLGLIYAALESLINGLSEHHKMMVLMGSNKFKKLSEELKECTAPIRLDTNSVMLSECWSAALAALSIGFQTRLE